MGLGRREVGSPDCLVKGKQQTGHHPQQKWAFLEYLLPAAYTALWVTLFLTHNWELEEQLTAQTSALI